MTNETPSNNNCISCTGEDRYLSMTEHLAKQLCSLHKLPPCSRQPAIWQSAYGTSFVICVQLQSVLSSKDASEQASINADFAVIAYEQLENK